MSGEGDLETSSTLGGCRRSSRFPALEEAFAVAPAACWGRCYSSRGHPFPGSARARAPRGAAVTAQRALVQPSALWPPQQGLFPASRAGRARGVGAGGPSASAGNSRGLQADRALAVGSTHARYCEMLCRL